jgi:type III pantothenate kinase
MPEVAVLLVVDIGNTNTVCGLYRPGEERATDTWRISTERDRMPDEWYAALVPFFGASGLAPKDVTAVAVSSVVPSVTRWFGAMCRERLRLEPLIVGTHLDLGIRVAIDNPAEAGTDRLVNSVAAFARYGGPAIVVDFGTSTNFDVVSAAGDYLGGALAPGMNISFEALAGRAARLFAVELRLPERAIGSNTVAALQSGVVLGYLAMLEGMIGRIRDELGGRATVVVTGGYAELFAAASPAIDHFDPDLTIDGLRMIWERVNGRGDQG